MGQWETLDTLSQNNIFGVLISTKIGNLKYEYDRATATDVFRIGDTAYKQKLTPHTGYKCLHVVLPY